MNRSEHRGRREHLSEAARRERSRPFEVLGQKDVHWRAPIPIPPSVRDFMAFGEHVVQSARALGVDVNPIWHEQPIFYFSNPAAIVGPFDDVAISPGSQRFDFELEVAAVIGIECRDADPLHAEEFIAGYLIFCDWSARDLQEHEMRMHLGPAKGKDSVTSLGPWMVTRDELADVRTANAHDLEMSAWVNGSKVSSGNLGSISWSFAELVAYAPRGTTLRPGDILASGTVGSRCILELSTVFPDRELWWLQPGDEVVLQVKRLGDTRSRIIAGTAPLPLRKRSV